MNNRSVVHSTFTIERTYKASAARVFAALSDPEKMKQWFAGPEEWGPSTLQVDFRVGGSISDAGGPPGGPVHRMAGVYYDIVPDERIIYAYELHLADRRISVSISTFELVADGARTHLTLTEAGAYLDGGDGPRLREEGTRELMDALGRYVEGTAN